MTAVKTSQQVQILIKLHHYIAANDQENANKLIELVNKLYNEKLYVAFAGHFSAGKSSMINKLLNEQVLPTSPIPTSANLVLLEKGHEQVILYSRAKESIELSGNYSIEQIKEYCKQGDEIERVYIKKPYSSLADNVVIMDTPGIDSTDAAHKLSTESMLHIADVIFYVTDYNHVQSEENLSFVKEMIDKGKHIFLIVNQIDKHIETEVPFTLYQKQIVTSFSEIGLEADDIFFTTLMKDHHPYNQLDEIREIIRAVVDSKEEFIKKNVQTSTSFIVKDLIEKFREELALTNVNEKELNRHIAELDKLKEKLNQELIEEEEKLKNLELDMRDKVATLLKNANLTPYETREKAVSYIESIQPSFKVGLIFTKAKTETEREKRINELILDLKKNTETQLTWHFKSLFQEYIQLYKLHDSSLLEKVQSFVLPITNETITAALKPGASTDNQYILTYSSDISDLIKKQTKQEAIKIIDQVMTIIREERKDRFRELKGDLGNVENNMDDIQRILIKVQKYDGFKKTLEEILSGVGNEFENGEQWLKENELYNHRVVDKLQIDISDDLIINEASNAGEANSLEMNNKEHFIKSTQEVINRLRGIKGFTQFTDTLESKVKSYNSRSFTVALFGAFSAGKSSFANAMIGNRLLPSSPTPTTATINKIAPTTEDKKHGLVEVYLKAKEILVKEIIESIPSLNGTKSFEELAEILNGLPENDNTEGDAIKKYKKAIQDYKVLTLNGLLINSTKDTFQDFVAKEEKACLVEEVIIYYDCPITKAGITLVDTPGADSLHKRHTDVAFQYIKKADAIIYVTYFNHPFSKGDREFLRQLGRVKDSFTLDKMFFVINAIDLAKDENEIKLVKQFIRDQLLKQEIRNIRLYGASSKNVLNGKIETEQDYMRFKEQFNHFIHQELTNTAIISIQDVLEQTNERLSLLIQAAMKDEAEKEAIKHKLLTEKHNVDQKLSELNNFHIIKSVNQELKELVFYVKQRVLFRFNDFFKESFHPGVFTKGSQIQNALTNSLNELIKAIEFEIVQELQATTLRIERFIKDAIMEEFERIAQLIKKQSASISFTNTEMPSIQTPAIQAEFTENMKTEFRPALKLFKNTKAFFEKNEKKVMADDLLMRIDNPVEIILDNSLSYFSAYYENIIIDLHQGLVKEMSNQATEGFLALLDIEATDIEKLLEEQSKIEITINLLNK